MRFPQDGWKIIQEEAREQGISATEFVRTAAVLYAIYLRTRRGVNKDELDALFERLRPRSG